MSSASHALAFPGYSSDTTSEEFPMTLIVGIVGADGIILAADKAQRERTDDGTYQQSLTKKIFHNPGRPFWACACSGDRSSIAVAQSVGRLCDAMAGDERPIAYEFKKCLEDIGNQTWSTTCDARKKRSKANDVISNCFVIYNDGLGILTLFRLEIASAGPPIFRFVLACAHLQQRRVHDAGRGDSLADL